LIKTEPKIKRQLSGLKEKLKEIESIRKSLSENEEAYHSKMETIASSSTLIGSLNNQMDEIKLLIETGGSCPTCKANIEDRKPDLSITFSQLGADRDNKKKDYNKLQEQSKSISAEKERLEKELFDSRGVQNEHTELLQKINEIKNANFQLETIDERLLSYTKSTNESLNIIKTLHKILKDDLSVYKDYDLEEIESQKTERTRLEQQEPFINCF